MKVVRDEGVPWHLVEVLRARGTDEHRSAKRWLQRTNGARIAAVEAAGYAILLTDDRNIVNQQSLRGRTVCVVALSLDRERAIPERADHIADTLRSVKSGQHLAMSLDGTRRIVRIGDNGEALVEYLPRLPPFGISEDRRVESPRAETRTITSEPLPAPPKARLRRPGSRGPPDGR